MSTLSDRSTYSPDQLSTYLTRIFPNQPDYSLSQLRADIYSDPLAALGRLQKHHLANNPWGNIGLHYSSHKSLSLEPRALYEKIVVRGLGGYCMEANGFFAIVLRSLGYELYTTGARISTAVDMIGNDPSGFVGFGHMVIIATINDKKYHVDVGFGNFGALSPIPFPEEHTSVTEAHPSVPGLWVRLVHRSISNNTTRQKLWVLETKNATSNVWGPGYCFSELEFLPQDFAVINYRTQRDPTSWFTYRLVVTKVLLDEQSEEPVGTVTLMGDTLSRRIGPTAAEDVEVFKTEAERVKGLRKWFGVKLQEDETNGILGMVTAIKG